MQSGFEKLMNIGGFAGMLEKGGVPFPSVLASMFVFVTGGGQYSLERWWRKRS